MKPLASCTGVAFLVVLFVAPCVTSAAVEATGATPALPTIMKGQIEAQIEEIEATTDLEEETRNRIVETYRRAISNLEQAKSYQDSAEQFTQSRSKTPAETKRMRSELEQLESQPSDPLVPLKAEISESTPLAELEQRLLKEQADLSAVEAKLAEFEKNLSEQNDRPDAVRKRLGEAKQEQEDVDEQLSTESSSPEAPAMKDAVKKELTTRQRALSAEVNMLDQELLSQPARVDLLKAQIDRTTLSVENLKARIQYLDQLVSSRRRDEVTEIKVQAAEEQLAARDKHPVVRELAAENADLTEFLQKTTHALEQSSNEKSELDAKASAIEHDLKDAQQKLKIVGLSQVLGKILQDQRRNLPDIEEFRKAASAREREIVDIELRQIQHAEERRKLGNLDAAVDERVTGVAPGQMQAVRNDARPLLKTRRDLLDKTLSTERAYLRTLGEVDFAHLQLNEIVRAYDDFLGENLLWIPSDRPVNRRTLTGLPDGLLWITSPQGWLEVLGEIGLDIRTQPLLSAGVLLVFGTLLGFRVRFWNVLRGTTRSVGSESDSISRTLLGLLVTLLLAVPSALLIARVGYRLEYANRSAVFARAVGDGLSVTAPILFNLRVFQIYCAPRGVAEGHFRWSQSSLAVLRHQIRQLILFAVPGAFVAATATDHVDPLYSSSLGLVAYVLIMLVITRFLIAVLHPSKGPAGNYLNSNRAGLLNRLRWVWFPLAVAAPLALAGLALVGYFYTAGTLTLRLVNTLWLVLGLIVARELALRWLGLARRRLKMRLDRERREADDKKESDASPVERESLDVDAWRIDIEAIDSQTRKLLNMALGISAVIGLWWIWSEVLPALGILDKISLWQHEQIVDGVTKVVPITLADLGLAIVLTFFTTVAVKNLPGLLEIAVLQRLSIGPGACYAITTLLSYVLVAAGIMTVFSILGGSWGELKWLVAALSVGLGFGLQEIVANFISGIIILFERPVRVGDIVTVGDTTGVVSRIRIRATTITNWDKQELLVPNKEFITGRLLNWSLSDQMNRIVITVGVAYGTEVRRAMDLMAQAAAENPNLLKDPAPLITFEGFAESSLTLIMRCYLDSLDSRLSTISDLHQRINEKLNEAGIAIAFPQRDVHIDTSRPLDIRLSKADDASPAPGGAA
jgi:potassium efflux system protein